MKNVPTAINPKYLGEKIYKSTKLNNSLINNSLNIKNIFSVIEQLGFVLLRPQKNQHILCLATF